MNNFNLNSDDFEVKPQFCLGDRVNTIIYDETSEGIIKGLNYSLHNHLPYKPNDTDCYYRWEYRVQFEAGYRWIGEEELLELNQPTINLSV